MTPHFSPRYTVVLLAVSVSACTTPSLSEDTAGALAVRATLASQIAHPDAVRNANPVNGIDGAAALQSQQKYEKTFGSKPTGADTTLVQRR